jgi:hypothetical protein
MIVFAIALVWMAELFNTAIEKTADLISKEKHPQIKLIKDVAAAAVLIAAIAAAVVGCIVSSLKLFCHEWDLAYGITAAFVFKRQHGAHPRPFLPL